MNRKRLVLVIALSGIVGLASLSYGIVALSNHNRDVVKQRLRSITLASYRRVPGTQSEFVYFPSLSVRVGPTASGDRFELNTTDEMAATERSPLFRHLNDRLDWFMKSAGFERQGVGCMMFFGGQGQIKAQAIAHFGVYAERVYDEDGHEKFKAMFPEVFARTSTTFDLKGEVPLDQYPNHTATRDEFVNPQDIDWMYDVKDFMHPEFKQ